MNWNTTSLKYNIILKKRLINELIKGVTLFTSWDCRWVTDFMGPQPFRLNRQGITLLSAILLGGYPIFSIFFLLGGVQSFIFQVCRRPRLVFQLRQGQGCSLNFRANPVRTQILYLPRIPVNIKLMLCYDCGIIYVYTFEEKCFSIRLFISFAIFDVKVPQIDIMIQSAWYIQRLQSIKIITCYLQTIYIHLKHRK